MAPGQSRFWFVGVAGASSRRGEGNIENKPPAVTEQADGLQEFRGLVRFSDETRASSVTVSSSFKLSAEASDPPGARVSGSWDRWHRRVSAGWNKGFVTGLEDRDAQGQARGPSGPAWGTAVAGGPPFPWGPVTNQVGLRTGTDTEEKE